MARTSVDTQLAKLRKAKEEIIKKENALLSKAQEKVISKIVQLAKDNGITASKIAAALKAGKVQKQKAAAGAKKSSGKVAPKYRNPNNPKETWTGRGKPPLWAKGLKEAGNIESTRILVSASQQ